MHMLSGIRRLSVFSIAVWLGLALHARADATVSRARVAASGEFHSLIHEFVPRHSSAGSCDQGELCLVSTVGADLSPGACAVTHTIDATVGDQLNFCYTVTNKTGIELDYHTLQSNPGRSGFALVQESLPDGETLQYNHIETVATTSTYDATWTAWDIPSGYSADVDASCYVANYIFAGGFDASSGCPGSHFVDITGTGTAIDLDDDGSAAVTMPFFFPFYGATSNEICVDNNGFVLFGTAACPASGYHINTSLPLAVLPAPAMMPLWDDFDATSGGVYYDARGAAPDREFVVEWSNLMHSNGDSNADGATFELILGENGSIRFEYADVQYTAFDNGDSQDSDDCAAGLCATIGLMSSAALFDEFSAFQTAVDGGYGIEWTPTALHTFESADAVTVNVGAPQIVVSPDPIDATVPAGGAETIPLAVGNVGDRDLHWTLNEALPADFHFPLGPRYAPSTIRPGETDVAALFSAELIKRTPRHASPGHAPPSNGAALAVGTPAFGCVITSATSCDYVAFDADAPGTVQTIATEDEPLFGASFVADDFSKEYVIGYPSGDLKTIDTSTGAITDVGATGFGTQMRDIAYDPTTDSLFGVAIDGFGTDLFTIDKTTGAITSIGPITGLGSPTYVMGLAIEPYTGLMYGIEIASSSLIAIDKTTGAASEIGPLGYTTRYSHGLSFSPAGGVLYLASIDFDTSSQNMYTVDVYTGHASLIGSIGNDIAQLGAFGIAEPAGPCSQPSDQAWLTLSPASGTTLPSGSTPVTVSVDASGANAGDVLSGTVCAASNDPIHHMVVTPIKVTVTP